jgi:DNA-binding NarL/FixJ family response regulator
MLKILLAEDNPIDESAMIQYLKNNLGVEFTTESAKSCKELLRILDEGKTFDIIVLDHILEDEQSLKYIDKIVSKAKDGQVIVLSGQTDISVCIQYLNAGVYAYLNKEANAFKNLVKNINEILAKQSGDLSFKISKSVVYIGGAALLAALILYFILK